MSEFTFPLPERANTPFGTLSEEVKQSLGSVVLGDPLAEDVRGVPYAGERTVPSDPYEWAKKSPVFTEERWKKYDMDAPTTYDQLNKVHRDLPGRISDLHMKLGLLAQSGEKSPNSDRGIEETMDLTLVPWRLFRERYSNLRMYIGVLEDRAQKHGEGNKIQNVARLSVSAVIENNFSAYRDLNNPDKLLTTTQYLDKQIEREGNWGLMVMQRWSEAGTAKMRRQTQERITPSALTNNGEKHFRIKGVHVDNMGIFEWLAMSLQDSSDLHIPCGRDAWLLANRSAGDNIPVASANYATAPIRMLPMENGKVYGLYPRLAII